MRRKLLMLVALVITGAALASAFVLTGASAKTGAPAKATRGAAGNIHIVLSFEGGQEVNFWAVSQRGMKDAAHDLGITAQWVAPKCCDLTQQVQLLNAAIGTNPSGIGVMLSDPAALTPPILRALGKKIPVVLVNVQNFKPQTDPRVKALSYVGQDETKSGAHAAALLLPYLKPGSQAVCINPAPTNIVAAFRCSSVTSYLKGKGITTNTLVDSSQVPSEQISILDGFMKSHPKVTGVIAPGPSGDYACKWLEAHASLKSKVAIGTFDLSPIELNCVARGFSKFSLSQQPYMQGYMAVVDLFNVIKYHTLPVNVDTGTAIVTQQNWKQFQALVKSGRAG
jgi:simple sugar transport system substrate-binding protein